MTSFQRYKSNTIILFLQIFCKYFFRNSGLKDQKHDKSLRRATYNQAPRGFVQMAKAIFETQKNTKGTKETKMLALGENMLF
jgi:hypothetical protein